MIRAVRRTVASLAAIPIAIAGLSIHAILGMVLAVLIVVAALCWAIADPGRAQRLSMIIAASRGKPRPPAMPAAPARSGPETRRGRGVARLATETDETPPNPSKRIGLT
jgi:hypothetical protein